MKVKAKIYLVGQDEIVFFSSMFHPYFYGCFAC